MDTSISIIFIGFSILILSDLILMVLTKSLYTKWSDAMEYKSILKLGFVCPDFLLHPGPKGWMHTDHMVVSVLASASSVRLLCTDLDLDLDSIGETSRDITTPRIANNLYFIFSKVVGKTLDVLWSYFAIPECANR